MATKRPHDGSDASMQPARKCPRSNFTDVIKVTIVNGDEEKTFVVYEDLICSRSRTIKNLRAELSDNAIAQLPVKIEHRNPGDFQVYLEWLLSGINNLTEYAETDCKVEWLAIEGWCSDEIQLGSKIRVLTSYWVLGEALGDVEFQNLVVDTILRQDTSRFPQVTVRTAIETAKRFARKTGLWRWAVDCVARKASDELVTAGMCTWPEVFTLDVMKELLRLRGTGKPPGFPRIQDKLKYHETE